MTSPDPSRPKQAALRYADLGYRVFPCVPGGKTPLTEHGYLDATADPEQIEKWWDLWPTANVAIATEGLLVIDIDGANNPWLAGAPDRQQELANAPTAATPRGGRHHVFRQPPGAGLRCSTGELAEHVDVRADGGHIMVVPSVTKDGAYQWLLPEEFDVPRDRLPLPPGWLLELVKRAAKESSGIAKVGLGGNPIPEGVRNKTLARLAGAMRRYGMTPPEIEPGLLVVNAQRCQPPLDEREVRRVAASIGSRAPDSVSVALAECHFEQDRAAALPGPLSVRVLMRQFPELRPWVIDGLLRRGETMNIIAPPKAGKSWLVMGIAMSVVSGRPWLGRFPTARGNVLIIDNELHPETTASRIAPVAAAMKIELSEIDERLFVLSLRGQLKDIDALGPVFGKIESGGYALIVLDAFYRVIPAGRDENDNGTMAAIYNQIDGYAERAGCCIALVHHSSKGNQASKSVTDVGAGAGSQSRAADAHLVLRQHVADGAMVVDAAVRSFPPVDPFVIQKFHPVWEHNPQLDPTKLRQSGGRKKQPEGAEHADANARAKEWTPEEFAKAVVGAKPVIRDELIARAKSKGICHSAAEGLMKRALEDGHLHRHAGEHNAPHRFSTVRPVLVTPGGRGGSQSSTTPGASAPGGCGGDSLPPSPPSKKKKPNRKPKGGRS